MICNSFCSDKPEREARIKEEVMKIKKFLIFLIGVFAMVAMLVSCCSYKEPGFTWPAMPAIAPPIATTVVEVTGDPGEKLRVQFDRTKSF